MKARIGALIGLLAVVVVVILIGGYWYVKDHTRISQVSLQSKVVCDGGRLQGHLRQEGLERRALAVRRLRLQSAREVHQGTRPAVGLGRDRQRLP